jgi:hypothetical protein
MFSLSVLDGLFASRIWPFIGRLTVRYRVQMNFGHPVSGFAKNSEEIISNPKTGAERVGVEAYPRIGVTGEESVSAYRRVGVSACRVSACMGDREFRVG